MKKSILLIILLIIGSSAESVACQCSIFETITSQYQTSDFVASVKILKNYKNTPDSNEFYKSDIEIIDLYKGKRIKSMSVFGSNGNNRFNSCGTFIDAGETRLIFGKLEKDGSISTYLCSSYHEPLGLGYKNNNIMQKLDLLKANAKTYKINVSREMAFYLFDFKQIYNTTLANRYSIVEVKLDKDGKLLRIKCLTKENKELIARYKDYFTNVINWTSRLRQIKGELGKPMNLFFEINPYTSTKPKS